MWSTTIQWALNALRFHVVPYSSSLAIPQDCSRRISILSCDIDNVDVLHATLLPLRLRLQEHPNSKIDVEKGMLDGVEGRNGTVVIYQRSRTRQEKIDEDSNPADQPGTDTVSVSSSESSSLAQWSSPASSSSEPAIAGSSSNGLLNPMSALAPIATHRPRLVDAEQTEPLPTTATPGSTAPSETEVTRSDRSSSMIVTSALASSITPSSISPSLSSSSQDPPRSPSTTDSSSSSSASSQLTSRSTTPSEVSESTQRESSTAFSSSEAHTSSSSLHSSVTSSRASTPSSLSPSSRSRTVTSSSWTTSGASGSTSSTRPSKTISNALSSSKRLSSTSRSKTMSSDHITSSDGSISLSSTPSLTTTFASTTASTATEITVSSSSSSTKLSASPSASSVQPTSSSVFSSHTVIASGNASSTSSSSISPTPSISTVTAIPIVVTTTTVTIARSSSSSTSTVFATPVLQPGVHSATGIKSNTRAIVGVSVSAAAALLALLFLIFFTCKRYRARRTHNGSTDNFLSLAREASWRRPVGGDDDESFTEGYGKSGSPSQPASTEGALDRHANTSAGDHTSNGHGSAETATAAIVRPMNPTFGGQPYIPGLGQSISGAITPPEPALPPPGYLPFSNIPDSSLPWRPSQTYDQPQVPVAVQRRVSAGDSHSRSDSGTSSNEHGVLSASWGDDARASTSTSKQRKSLSGPRAMLKTQKSRRHSSTPPSAFLGVRDSDCEGQGRAQPGPQSDRMSVRSFISRLRSGRRTSTHSVATVRGGSGGSTPFAQNRNSDASMTIVPGALPAATTNVYSPSLLNPPIALPPRPLLSFPRGVTGLSYGPQPSATHQVPASNFGGYDELGTSNILWPPVTLPSPTPSPAPTDQSSMVEGLLHPRLGAGLDHSQQASMASLQDNEDYTRPINGLIHNHLRSTTTFDTQDPVGLEDGKIGQAI